MTERRRFLAGLGAFAAAEPLGLFAVHGIAAEAAPAPTGKPAPARAPSPNARAAVDLKHFSTLSSLLTGYAALDPTAAAVYLRSVRANAALAAALDDTYARSGIAGNAPPTTLAALTATGIFATPATLALTSTILAAWFSGTYAATAATTTETWDEALAWKACTFTKPPATCGGATGYWSRPPA